jgi:pyruvate,orthophosphate dikinase
VRKATKRKAAKPSKRQVYFFGGGRAQGRASMSDLLGGKGANLAEMNRLGMPVPAGFTISTEVCGEFYRRGRKLSPDVKREIGAQLRRVEKVMGGRFGDSSDPLLVSVRSGARASMPGMMDTILNLGLNDATVEGLATASGDRRFAYDSYRRFIQMYADVVLGMEHHAFEERLEALKASRDTTFDTDLSSDDLVGLVRGYEGIVREETGRDFPQDPLEQLWGAIAAVFDSWETPRAIK